MKHYFFKVKFTAFCTVIFSVISVACLAAIPMLHKKLFDSMPGDWNSAGLMMIIGLYGAAFIFCCIFEYLCQRTAWLLDWKIHILFRTGLYRAICRKSYQEFASVGIGEYLSKFQNDVEAAASYMNSGINSIKYILQIAVYFAFIITLDWRILAVIIVGTVIALAVPRLTGKELSNRKKIWIKKQGKYLDLLKDLFNGFGENNYKTWENLKSHHQKNLYETEDSMLSFGKFSAFVHVINGGILYAINLLCFTIVGILYFTGRITSGTGVAALGYVNSFIDPLRYLLEEISNMKATRGVVNGLVEFINAGSRSSCSKGIKNSIHKIEMIGVNKKFENFELKDINICFEKGKRYAVIGPNGSGKSTLFKIIGGFENADSGKVLFDGADFEALEIRDMVYSMSPFSHIFNCDVSENITVFSSYKISEKHGRFSEALWEQLQKKIGEENTAVGLSNGEKQRITFLRALTADFPVMLFDEPFSAMDKDNSNKMNSLLDSLKNKILIIITHDLLEQNLKCFDTIIGLKDGKIKVIGTPNEIIGSKFYGEIIK